jgi:hypothetical protein
MPPKTKRSGPRAAEPEDRHQNIATATAKRQGPSPVVSVRRGSRNRQQVPIAPASVFGPVGRRRTWWYTYRCRICGAYLFGRAKTLDAVTGERKAGCGHRVQIMAARIYSQPESGAAA